MDVDPIAIARELFDAQRTAAPIGLLTERFPDLDWDTARAIARATDDLRRAAGDIQIGWKLGWTSEAMRTALGINRPNWGTLWQSQVAAGELRLDQYIHPKLEPELVWRAGADLSGPDVTAEDIANVGGEWALGIEVVDPRFPSFAFDALDNTADNSSSAAICVGSFHQDDSPAERIVTLSNGTEDRSGPGAQAMGSPLEAVSWLVRSLSEEELSITAGYVVFTGGLTAPFDVAASATYSLTSAGMGPVKLNGI